jgi:hypothetical protein
MGQNVANAPGSFPSLADIMSLVRGIVNDTQAGPDGVSGSGQIISNNPTLAPFTQPFLNSAIRAVFRELRNVGDPQLIKDNIIISGLPPINGPLGLSVPDPSIQVQLGIAGFYDGSQVQGNFKLPSDVIYPERLWERTTGSNLPFQPMNESQFGIPSRVQSTVFGQWEWRANSIFMTGATTTRDVRMRYYASFTTIMSPSLNFATTLVPIQDSLDAIAYKVAKKYAVMLGSPLLEQIDTDGKEEMRQLKNSNTRRMQSVDYFRQPFQGNGGDNGDSSNGGNW